MSQFLLPCACGANMPVNRSQAGMSLPCPNCGKTVEVPTIRKLAEFATSAPVKKQAKSSQSATWLGPIAALSLIVGLIAFAYAGYLYYERYSYVALINQSGGNLNVKEADFLEDIRNHALESAPADTWDYWNIMLEEGLPDPDPPDLFKIKRYLASRAPMLFGSLFTGGIGLAIFAFSSFLLQKLRAR